MLRRALGLCSLLLPALVLLGMEFGCASQNPSYFPYLLPAGKITPTHGKPGFGYYANFDPHACKLEVRPLESTNPVQTQQVLIATVYDGDGKPRRGRRVEWMTEGVGNIIEADESGVFSGRGYKWDNKYAVSYTAYSEHRVTRGNNNPNDDFVIRPGQSWCVISSGVEGDTHVTAYAPGIFNWEQHKVFVTKHWVDAGWTMPPPAVNRAGTEHIFTTNVFRHTDRQPLANYRVRYRILEGPPAVFLPNRTQEAVVISDLSGNANVTLVQAVPQPGVNRVGVEIIRPPDPTAPSGTGIVIGKGETTKEWLAPMIAVTKSGPPTGAVGQEIPFSILITNTGKVEVQALTVRDAIPDGLQYVRSQPPAIQEGNQLIWTLGTLNPGQAHTLQAVFRATRIGSFSNSVAVTSVDGVRAEANATTAVTAPKLEVAKTGPVGGALGAPIAYQITVSNPGTGPATNVILSDSFDAGLEHESKANPVELQLGTLAPGETRTVPLNLTARQLGRLVNRVTATADGGLTARAEHPVLVQQPQLTITKTGPTARYVDRPAIWDIRVINPGDVPLTGVVVRDTLPPELSFVSANENGQSTENQVIWNVGRLEPKQQKLLQVTTKCLKLTPRALNVAVVTADPNVQVRAEAPIEIRGLPAFRLEVVDVDDPVEVGAKTTYRIDVTNQGSLPGDQVEIIAIVPKEMKVINANGPSQPKFDGLRVVFPPVDSVKPGQTLNYAVEVQALEPGDVRFRAELRSQTLGTVPVIEEESTHIYPAGGNGAVRPPPAAPAPAAPLTPITPVPPPSGSAAPPPSGTPAPPPSGVPAPAPVGPTPAPVPR